MNPVEVNVDEENRDIDLKINPCIQEIFKDYKINHLKEQKRIQLEEGPN
jgi:hypothetical protein